MAMINNIISFGIFFSVILGLGSISGLFSERSGVVNIAINGMMIFGALLYGMIAKVMDKNVSGWVQLPIFLIVGLCCSLFALLHGFAAITLKANQIASGTALNLLGSGLALFFINYVFKGEGMNTTFSHVALSELSIEWQYAVSLPVFLGLFIFGFSFVFLRYTKTGKYIKAAGENPYALEAQGVSVTRIRYLALMISGFMAGVAGAIFTQNNGFFDGNIQGLGFIALAILIFGRWRITWVLIGALIFGSLNAVVSTFVFNPSNISKDNWLIKNTNLLQILPFLLSLITLVFTSLSSKVPKYVGIPFDKASG